MTDTEKKPNSDVVTIKKYANRRLYNTSSSAYVTHESLCQMVKDGVEFVVYDARTNEDITRSVLTQIIVDEEGKGQNLLPVSFLRQLISFYGDSMQWLVPGYLESSMKSFTHNQDKMRQYLTEAFGGLFSFNSFETMTKQNMAMVENAMKLFTPGMDKLTQFDASLLNPTAKQMAEMLERSKSGDQSADKPESQMGSAANLQQLQLQLGHLQKQLDLMLQTQSDQKETPSQPVKTAK